MASQKIWASWRAGLFSAAPLSLAPIARLAAAIPGHSSAAPALRTMMRAFLLAAAATVATALTPAQADLLLSLQGRLQELNVRRSLTTIVAPASADLLALRLIQLEQLEALYSLLDDDGSGSLTVHEMIVSPAPRRRPRAPPQPPRPQHASKLQLSVPGHS